MSTQSAGHMFDMNLRSRYFLLLTSARKDIEIRVLYPKYRALGLAT